MVAGGRLRRAKQPSDWRSSVTLNEKTMRNFHPGSWSETTAGDDNEAFNQRTLFLIIVLDL
jgi:hypothetical protein